MTNQGQPRRFAMGSTDGPDISNLQLNFWRLAVQKFEEIQEKWRRYAIDETSDNWPEYTENEFKVDAAIALVLAGTSIAELVGQNLPCASERTKPLGGGLDDLFGGNPPSGTKALIKIYNDLRHFGAPKHEAVWGVTEEILCEHLKVAQKIWLAVLKRQGHSANEDFRHSFVFE